MTTSASPSPLPKAPAAPREPAWSRLGQRIRSSQIRAEIRRLETSAQRLRGDLARALLPSPDLPAEIPLTPRLAGAREELRRVAAEIEDSRAVRDAEKDRERRVEDERDRNLRPLRQAMDEAQRKREELRKLEERVAREGLAIARRRELLDRELQSAPAQEETEFAALRRRHATEELEALERRASELTVDREEVARQVAAAERALAAARTDHASRATDWDAPLAEARAHRQAAEARLSALERRERAAFDEVAPEAAQWAESWQQLAQPTSDERVLRLLSELGGNASRTRELMDQLGPAASRGELSTEQAGDSRFFFWLALAGAGMLFLTAGIVVLLAWAWLGSGSPGLPRAVRAAPVAGAVPQRELGDLMAALARRGLVLKAESIPFAVVGAVDGQRVYPFADVPGALEIYAFGSEEQAKAARKRLGRLVPDPRDQLFTENSDLDGRFVVWGLAQFSPKERRAFKTGFHAASH